MALLTCPECSRGVSNEASACPQCGYPVSKMRARAATPPPIPGARSQVTATKPPNVSTSEKSSRGTSAGLLVVLLAGLIFLAYRYTQRTSEPSHSGAPPVQLDQNAPRTVVSPRPEPRRGGLIVDEQITIKEDFWYSSIIDLNRDAAVTVKVDVLAGPEVETWVMDPDAFQKFDKAGKSFLGGEFMHFQDFRMTNVRRDQRTARLRKGRYYFVIDNSDQGETKSPSNFREDSAQVRLTIEAR